jgi:hypothetical protein
MKKQCLICFLICHSTGFQEHLLSIPTSAGFCSILRPDVVRLLSQNLSLGKILKKLFIFKKKYNKSINLWINLFVLSKSNGIC